MIDPERDCNRKRQGVLSVIGLTIAAMMLGALAVFTGSGAMAQDTVATAPTAVAGAVAPVLKIDTGDRAWILTSTALVLAMTRLGLRSSTADWSGASTSWARSCRASSYSAWSA